MRRFVTLFLVILFVLSASVGYAAPAQPTEPYAKVYKCVLDIQPKVAKPGESVSARGGGFEPYSVITVILSDGTVLTTKADATGSINFSFVIPLGSKDGIYSVHAEGPLANDVNSTLVSACNIKVQKSVVVEGDTTYPPKTDAPASSASLTERTAQRGELPMTGGALLWALLIAGIALAATGIGLKATNRK